MSDFKETIKGNNYTIEDAKELFIDYTLRHNGKISQRFRDMKVKIYTDRLPNGSNALANANVEDNEINMKSNQSIITFFHESKHLADAWKDSSNKWHTNWNDEHDYTKQMVYEDKDNQLVQILRGVKGMAMGEAIAELFACKIYWELCDNSPNAHFYTAQERKTYDEEIITLKKIIAILGLNEDDVLSWESNENFGRQNLEKLFATLTGKKDFWTLLENRMDYIIMPKFIRISHPQFKISETSLKNVKIFKEDIEKALENCMKKDLQKSYYLSIGCSEEEFEEIFQKKQQEFEKIKRNTQRLEGLQY